MKERSKGAGLRSIGIKGEEQQLIQSPGKVVFYVRCSVPKVKEL